MKLSHLIYLSAFLCLCTGVWAQNPPPDPLAEHLFPPELIVQNGEDIGLTEEQRDFLMTQLQQAQGRFAEMHGKLQKEVEALRALLKKERVEEAAALAQFDKLLTQEQAIKRAHLVLVLSLKNKLTAEQQTKLQEIKRQAASGKPPASLQARIEAKLEKVKAGVEKWQNDGRDPSPIAEIMQEFEPLMKAGKVKEAEALLEKALKLLGESQEGKRDKVQKDASTKAATPDALRAKIEALRDSKVQSQTSEPGPSIAATPSPPSAVENGLVTFVNNLEGLNIDHLYTMNPDGSNLKRLTNAPNDVSENDPDWSPDGTKLVFASNRGELPKDKQEGNIYVMNADGSNIRKITTDGGRQPAWAFGGRRAWLSRAIAELLVSNLKRSVVRHQPVSYRQENQR